MSWVGSRWWSFDFHCHTPASDDYGKGPDQAVLKETLPRDWLLQYMRAGIDCVAVTDHNSGEWIDILKQALVDLRNEDNPDFRPLYIFPGVEVMVSGNIHVLAIFPMDKSTSDIDSFIGAVGYSGTKGRNDGCSVRSIVEVVDIVTQFGGIAIPAHVDDWKNGLLKACSGTTLDQVLNHTGILAIEIVDLTCSKPQLYIDKKTNWSEVLGSDSHYPTGTRGQRFPGSHFTWVKMSEPSFDGLRLALIDGSLSLRRSDQLPEDPNEHGPLYIEEITVSNAKYVGRVRPFNCRFNPWLNAIIGGRGSGKSTILESLRNVLKREDEIPESLKSELAKYRTTSVSRQDEWLLLGSTVMSVVYRKDGGRFRITWENADNSYKIEQETAPSQWRVTEGDITQRFPVRIYSQKQIFDIAKHPQALLKVIDDAPEVDYRNWELRHDELVKRYFSIQARSREIRAGLQEESYVKGQLSDVKRKLEVFESAGHANTLKEYQLRQNQSRAIEIWENSWADSAEKVRAFAAGILPEEIDTESFLEETVENRGLLQSVGEIRSSFMQLQSRIQEIANEIDDLQNLWHGSKTRVAVLCEIARASEEYELLIKPPSEVGATDPSDYGKLVKYRQDLEEQLKTFEDKQRTLEVCQLEAEKCLREIAEHRVQITKHRDQFLKKTLAENPHVRIEVIPYGNTETIEDELRSLINRENGFDRDIGSVYGEEGLLSIFTKDHSQALGQITELKSALLGIRGNEPERIESTKDKRFVSHIQSLPPDTIDRIQCWFPEDSLEVQYSLKGDDFRPVAQGSPGQKTAALLAFILSYGDEPLILDQPEDDLDNHLIYELIVTQLREIKERRQVLVVTHNANIVVNGDAENIIALDVRSGQTQIAAQGGLQELSIRDEICKVMEGGKEAFEQRYRRISVDSLL